MLDCGFNLLVYGYGSKADVLTLFSLKHMSSEHTLIFRAFDSRCTMKNIVECIVNWFLADVYQNQIKNRAERFPKNVSLHEQIMNIKREFIKIGQRYKDETD